jgi:putative lipoic acid-binding regulatory protein
VAEQAPPKIEYPCAYPIKIIGRAHADFRQLIVDVLQEHDPTLEDNAVVEIPSGKGTFVSLRVSITATGDEHVKTVVSALMATGRVKMVI